MSSTTRTAGARRAAPVEAQPPPHAAIPRHEGDVAAQAAADARRAANELAEADDALTLARARLQEAIDEAPRVSPRVATAAADVSAAEELLDHAVEAQLEADRRAEDCRGAVLVAQAAVEDLAGSSTVTGAQQVRAEQGLAQAQRAVVSAERALTRRTAARQHAGDVLAGAEQGLEEARSRPQSDSSAVLKARMDLGRSERAQRAAQERAAATKKSYEQVVHNADGGAAALPVRKYYGSLDEFVVEYLLRNWRRRDGDTTSHWCARWWKHAEAGTRLGHLWEAFEVLRHEQAPGMS
ncbi:DUF4913 domain-containing protein, partial [Allobranchiibius huperziae]